MLQHGTPQHSNPPLLGRLSHGSKQLHGTQLLSLSRLLSQLASQCFHCLFHQASHLSPQQ